MSGPHFRDYHLLLDEHADQIFATCAYRKSNPAILMMQSAQDRTADNAPGCLDGP
jgi:hypothetical protein